MLMVNRRLMVMVDDNSVVNHHWCWWPPHPALPSASLAPSGRRPRILPPSHRPVVASVQGPPGRGTMVPEPWRNHGGMVARDHLVLVSMLYIAILQLCFSWWRWSGWSNLVNSHMLMANMNDCEKRVNQRERPILSFCRPRPHRCTSNRWKTNHSNDALDTLHVSIDSKQSIILVYTQKVVGVLSRVLHRAE